MNSPSSAILINQCDIYSGTPGVDLDGGPQYTYPAAPTIGGVACTAQPGTYTEMVDELSRVTKYVEWWIMFGRPVGVKPRDKIIHVDLAGVSHTLFVLANIDNAGRGAAYTVRAEERV